MDQFGSGEPVNPVRVSEPESLLKKYDIPIDHLDFAYVGKCINVRELEQILHILISGQEGYFPELVKSTEERLAVLNPNSKFLRKQVPVLTKYDLSTDEWSDLTNDVENWINDMNKNDTELSSFNTTKDDYNEVPIRGLETVKKSAEKKPERIKSMDYAQWDKLDVDAEILKMEIEEEKIKKQCLKKQEEKEKLNTVVVKPEYMTEAELTYSAEQERTRGNEFYRSGDYEEALSYYTNSLNFRPSVAVYNNRAIAYIKLNEFEEAVNDCNEALKIDVKNEKALIRKAMALKSLKKYKEAIQTLQRSIEINPNNKITQNMMNSLLEMTSTKSLRSVRMMITEEPKEIEVKDDKKESKDVVVPIPGTSNDKPPYYKVLNVPEELELKYKESCKKTYHPSDDKVINLSGDDKENEQSNAQGSRSINLQEITPYEFIKQWQIIKNDSSLAKLEAVLRGIKPKYILPVIGNKLDGQMLSLVLLCLRKRFMSAGDAKLVMSILVEFSKLPRFDLVAMLLNKEEKEVARDILKFIASCGYELPPDVCRKLS